ncbi:hypothetical protein [Streptomyces sp. NBC_00328]|uniref:hypothetical protein n=1 Tax=Streptomyces sp. NBC_00328 TaxID=2903646 RepID=UPI002E2E6E89|nr:hypothetical protein [Streptomyces sp. NBC_00328]
MLGSLPLDRRTRDAVRPLLAAHPTTATDVLRLLHVRSGGEADLAGLRRFRSPPRPLRRRLLSSWGAHTEQALRERVLARALGLFARRPGEPPCALLEAEAVRRLSSAPRFGLAVLDADLTGLAVPSAERASAKARAGWARRTWPSPPGCGHWSPRSGGTRPRTRRGSPPRPPRRGMRCSPWRTEVQPRPKRADPCTGCCPARSTAAVWPP